MVRREGNSFTLLVCSHLGGGGGVYPCPIMLCKISQNAMGQPPGGGGYPARSSQGGVPCQVQPGGYPARGVPCWGVPCQGDPAGGTLPGGYPAGGDPATGGTQVSSPPPPPSQVRTGGGTQLGQHREYLLHVGRFASCVHAGGLSCLSI